MKNIKGWYLPDWDNHFEFFMVPYKDQWTYQQPQRDFALSFVKSWNYALDIGGNIGLWSKDLCNQFKNVLVVEPHPENIECFKANMKNFDNWQIEKIALSDHHEQNAELYVSPDESGNISLIEEGVMFATTSRILKKDQLKIIHTEVKMLNDYIDQFNGKNIDFIKVDCQEHEKEIVNGGLELLKKHDAVLCLELPCRNIEEMKYHDEVVAVLKDIGYMRRAHMIKETLFTT